MQHGGQDAEALRRALYRPGASETDLDSYLAVAPQPEPSDEPTAVQDPSPRPAGRRRWLWAAGAVAAVALVGGAIATGALESAPSAAPTASAPVQTVAVDPGTGQLVPLPTVVDHGARPGAMGTALRMGVGQYLYTVAAGDTVPVIAQRFRLCDADVLVSLPYGFDAGAIPPGKQLLLSRAASAGMCRAEGVRG